MNRPVGVTILAVLDFLGAMGCFFGGLGFLLGGGAVAAAVSQNSQLASQLPPGVAGLIGAMGAAVGIGLFIGGILNILIGWGMWKLKNWARIITMVFLGLGALGCALVALLSLIHFSIIGIVWNGFWLAVYGLIIWYLLQPNVKAAFAGRPRTMAATA